MKQIILCCLCLFIVGCSRQERTETLTAAQPGEVNSLMQRMRDIVLKLQPTALKEKDFVDAGGKLGVGRDLAELRDLSQRVHKSKSLNVPRYRVSAEALHHHLTEMEKAYSQGDRKYARWMMQATPMICMSCHNQEGLSAGGLWDLSAEVLKGTDFENAEIMFATRNNEKALPVYESLIRRFGSVPLSESSVRDLETSFKRLLIYDIQISRQPEAASKRLTELLKNQKLPQHVKRRVSEWLKSTGVLVSRSLWGAQAEDTRRVLSYAAKILDARPRGSAAIQNESLVSFLDVAGLLYARLDREERPALIAETLYWLAIADFGINNEFFLSLGNLYLRDCMTHYSQFPIAKKCYQEFKDQMQFLYSGSRGEDLPQDVVEDLTVFADRVGVPGPSTNP